MIFIVFFIFIIVWFFLGKQELQLTNVMAILVLLLGGIILIVCVIEVTLKFL